MCNFVRAARRITTIFGESARKAEYFTFNYNYFAAAQDAEHLFSLGSERKGTGWSPSLWLGRKQRASFLTPCRGGVVLSHQRVLIYGGAIGKALFNYIIAPETCQVGRSVV